MSANRRTKDHEIRFKEMRNKKQTDRTRGTGNSGPQTPTMPGYQRILIRFGLVTETQPIPDVWDIWLRAGSDRVVSTRKTKTMRKKHTLTRFAQVEAALSSMDENDLAELKWRLESPRS
jgi:hypothetical protein